VCGVSRYPFAPECLRSWPDNLSTITTYKKPRICIKTRDFNPIRNNTYNSALLAYKTNDFKQDYLLDTGKKLGYPPVREAKVTIALGLKTPTGAVLCTDSQITKEGGLKYRGKKICDFIKDDGAVSIAFAGSPSLMQALKEQLTERLKEPRNKSVKWTPWVRKHVAAILADFHKHHRTRPFEILCVVSARDGSRTEMYRGQGKLLVDVEDFECVGVGDSSVLHYLASVLFPRALSLNQAVLLGCYLIMQAVEYIDGCGGPLQARAIRDGCISKIGNVDEQAKLEGFESCLGELFWTASQKDAKQEQLDGAAKDLAFVLSRECWSRGFAL
jgi:20S proteasome alpha/beta subunit